VTKVAHIYERPERFWCGAIPKPEHEPGHLMGLEHAIREHRQTCAACVAAGMNRLAAVPADGARATATRAEIHAAESLLRQLLDGLDDCPQHMRFSRDDLVRRLNRVLTTIVTGLDPETKSASVSQ
jgi:hypothetical protein